MNNLLNYSSLRALFSPALFSCNNQQTTPKKSEAGSITDYMRAHQYARSGINIWANAQIFTIRIWIC